MKKIFTTKSAEETQKLGEELIANMLKKRVEEAALVLALEGDLGGGKTTFAQGVARGLGVKEQITSPTFVLIKRYQLKNKNLRFKNFYHIDCYRLTMAWQLQELGFDEIVSNPENIIVVEWAEKARGILPNNTIRIKFEYFRENERSIVLEG